MFEQYNSEGINVFVVEEICMFGQPQSLLLRTDWFADKDQATFEAHIKTDYFQAAIKLLPEEDLLAAPLDIKKIQPFAGYTSR